MQIAQITPGAGGMYCGNCFRDSMLVTELQALGHSALLVPLYLPMTLEGPEPSQKAPIFFSGVNVYLEQISSIFRHSPNWVHRGLAHPRLLSWVARFAGRTPKKNLGPLTISMLQGEQGRQSRELDELIHWFGENYAPDVICLSNALLVGLTRRLKEALNAVVVCLLAGEDTFLDQLSEPYRKTAWRTLAERAREVDLFIAPSRYFADLMKRRLELDDHRVRVVHNGIDLAGYRPAETLPSPPVLGYFARICKEKGVDFLVEAYLSLKERDTLRDLKLKIGGGLEANDLALVTALKKRLDARGVLGDVEFHPNVERHEKQAFLRGCTVLSVPTLYGEAFGLYVLEALASGVPVVQPRHAAFPELVEKTGGGVLFEGDQPGALADAIEALLLDHDRRRKLGSSGRRAVEERFTSTTMAKNMSRQFSQLLKALQGQGQVA